MAQYTLPLGSGKKAPIEEGNYLVNFYHLLGQHRSPDAF